MLEVKPLLLGACGYTGRLVASGLKQLGVPFLIGGRSEQKLKALKNDLSISDPPVVVDLNDVAQVLDLAKQQFFILNCVGPFSLFSQQLIQAIANCGGMYMDIAGEQPFVFFSQTHCDGPARKNGATLIHACAFESFLADMLAQVMCRADQCYSEIASYYWFENGVPSPGTRLTMRLVPHWQTQIFTQGQFIACQAGEITRSLDWQPAEGLDAGVFAPFPEIQFFARRFKTHAAGSYYALKREHALLVQAARGRSVKSVAEILARADRQIEMGPDRQARFQHRFGIAVRSVTEQGHSEMLWIHGRDPYGLTAAIMVWCWNWMRQHWDGSKKRFQNPFVGVCSPAEIFPAIAFFKALARWSEFDIQMNVF